MLSFIFIRYKRERKKKEEGKRFFVRAFLYALHLMYIRENGASIFLLPKIYCQISKKINSSQII